MMTQQPAYLMSNLQEKVIVSLLKQLVRALLDQPSMAAINCSNSNFKNVLLPSSIASSAVPPNNFKGAAKSTNGN